MTAAVAAVAAAAALAASGAAAATPPTIPDCYAQVVAPTSMVLACADGNLTLEGLSWSGWGKPTATATGDAHANDCDPYCAAGTFRTYPVSVTASDPQTCRSGRRQYTHLVWSTQAKPPPGLANPAGDLTFPCSWGLHPGLRAYRSNGFVILTGKAWTRSAACPKKVRLTTGSRTIAEVALSGTGFRTAWRAPAGRHLVVARQSCRGSTLYEASVVVQ
jgi:hypothetical protein